VARTTSPTAGTGQSDELSRKMKEFASRPSEEETASAPDAPSDDPSARPRAARQARCQPTIRLASVSVMSEDDQRRLELLLYALVERRVARHLQQGEP
jgi:hypothetical protein